MICNSQEALSYYSHVYIHFGGMLGLESPGKWFWDRGKFWKSVNSQAFSFFTIFLRRLSEVLYLVFFCNVKVTWILLSLSATEDLFEKIFCG